MGFCRHVAAHIGDPNENSAIADADSLVKSDIRVITHVDVRNATALVKGRERFLVIFSYLIEWDMALGVGHVVGKMISVV